jgi:ABC-type multidrug transport system ATPase subunit
VVSASDSAPLVAAGLVKAYGNHQVLGGIDLQVNAGEAVVLLGPNGAGKSTLLGCICGSVVPDAGRVEIAGAPLRDAPVEARRHLRYLPQEVEVPAGLTGRELLAFFADVHGDAAGRSRAERFVQFGDALDHFATTYSVGMRRQLAFAGLLVGTARLWVLDEPFAGVDADGRLRMLEVLQRALTGGAGLLLAAHDQDADALQTLQARAFPLHLPASRQGGRT